MSIKDEIEKYRNETVYQTNIRLPYCQWDLRDLVNSTTERMNVKKMTAAQPTWEQINEIARQNNLDALGLGMVLMKEQAINAVFQPSKNWLAGKYIFGNTIKEIYYNPNPIIVPIKKYERVYRIKTLNEKGRVVPGERCFPTLEELSNKEFRDQLFIYDVYLIAILDKTEDGKYKMLHRIPITFSPKKTTGLKFANELNNFQLQCAAFYGRNIAPFIFAMYLKQELTVYANKDDETLTSQVMAMASVPITSQTEADERFVGSTIADELERWYAIYVSPHPNPNSTDLEHPTVEVEENENTSPIDF